MAKKILVPVDGSKHALAALDVAADLAAQRGQKICLLHVVPSGGLPAGMEQWETIENVHDSPRWLYDEGVAQNVLTAAADRIADKPSLEVEQVVDRGDPAKSIIALSKADDVAMVVMGCRGLSDFMGLVLGSVAHKVSHGAKCPVVTVT
jgi:nucleotide-binding universal stress UspA family protein